MSGAESNHPWMYVSRGWEKEIFSFLMTDVVCSFKQQQLETNRKLRTLGIASKINHGLGDLNQRTVANSKQFQVLVAF